MTTPTVEVCPTCFRPTEHVEPHFDEEYCICSCCTCETSTGCCCTQCACDGVKGHRARITRRIEDEGPAWDMDRERDLDEAEADREAALAWREGRDE